MGAIDCSKREIILYYDSRSPLGKKTLAYAKASGFYIWEMDIRNAHFTGTQLLEMANDLKIDVGDLVNKQEMEIKFHNNYSEFNQEDWLKILLANPELLCQPVARRGNHVVLIHTPSDIFQLEQEEVQPETQALAV